MCCRLFSLLVAWCVGLKSAGLEARPALKQLVIIRLSAGLEARPALLTSTPWDCECSWWWIEGAGLEARPAPLISTSLGLFAWRPGWLDWNPDQHPRQIIRLLVCIACCNFSLQHYSIEWVEELCLQDMTWSFILCTSIPIHSGFTLRQVDATIYQLPQWFKS